MPLCQDLQSLGWRLACQAKLSDQYNVVDPLSSLDDSNVNQSKVHVDVEGNNSESGEQSVILSSDEDKQDVGPFYIPPAPKPLAVGGAGSGSPNPSA